MRSLEFRWTEEAKVESHAQKPLKKHKSPSAQLVKGTHLGCNHHHIIACIIVCGCSSKCEPLSANNELPVLWCVSDHVPITDSSEAHIVVFFHKRVNTVRFFTKFAMPRSFL